MDEGATDMQASTPCGQQSTVTGRLRILVTGGAGFLGCHLIRRLLKEGHEVICVDNYVTGSKTSLQEFMGNPSFDCLRHDVTEPLQVECDQIYHMACPASPVGYSHNPIKSIKTAFIGTLHVLGIARCTGARVLIASTSEVYGDPEVHPQDEEYYGSVNCTGPRACYDEGKRASEALAMAYHRMHNIPVRIARIFNTYGPGMALFDGRVVSNFITQALSGQDLTIYGTGDQTRSFCYVDDMVEGLIRLMNSDETGPMNLGNPTEITIRECAEKIRQTVNPKVSLRFVPLPMNDPVKRQPNIDKARRVLNWEPRVSFEEGLLRTQKDLKRRFKEATVPERLVLRADRYLADLSSNKEDKSRNGSSYAVSMSSSD